MWSLLFCISRTSTFSRFMAARTAVQRRSSSAVEIGVCRRSLSPLPAIVVSRIVAAIINTLAGEDKIYRPRGQNLFSSPAKKFPPPIPFFFNFFLGGRPRGFVDTLEGFSFKG